MFRSQFQSFRSPFQSLRLSNIGNQTAIRGQIAHTGEGEQGVGEFGQTLAVLGGQGYDGAEAVGQILPAIRAGQIGLV